MRRTLITLVFLPAAGCGLIPPASPQRVDYVCDAERTFSVTYLPARKAATIEFGRSRFDLLAELHDGSGERYACNVLTLWRNGDTARVELQGESFYENCRARH